MTVEVALQSVQKGMSTPFGGMQSMTVGESKDDAIAKQSR